MFQAFMVVLREGVEAFLIVAITAAYLRKTGRAALLSAVWWGIFASVAASGALGYVLWVTGGANQPLWEGIFAAVTVVLVTSFVVHMWRTGSHLKRVMENKLSEVTQRPSSFGIYLGIFFFTVLMVSREGMETALLLFQIQSPNLVAGAALGILGAGAIAFLWQQFGYLVPLTRFFQITAVFLILFVLQIGVQAFHEFTEAGIFPASEALHAASEPYSMDGRYGIWYSNAAFFGCALWLALSLIFTRRRPVPAPSPSLGMDHSTT